MTPLRSVARQARARAPPRRRGRARDRLPDRRPVLPTLAREHRAERAAVVDAEGCAAALPRRVVPPAAVRRDGGAEHERPRRRLLPDAASSRRCSRRSRIPPPSATRRSSRTIPVAVAAVQHHRVARGTVRRGGQTYAEVAYPVGDTAVMLSASLHDQLQAVALVRRRVFVAGALAMGFAVLFGYAGASLITRRIRRLETAAERIAEGIFDEPVVDHGSDEVGAARAHVRADAAAAREPRPGPRRVHRQRLARAADAPLLARRLPRAAGRP